MTAHDIANLERQRLGDTDAEISCAVAGCEYDHEGICLFCGGFSNVRDCETEGHVPVQHSASGLWMCEACGEHCDALDAT